MNVRPDTGAPPLSGRLWRAFVYPALIGVVSGFFTVFFMWLYGAGYDLLWGQRILGQGNSLAAGLFIALMCTMVIALLRRGLTDDQSPEVEFAKSGGVPYRDFSRTFGIALLSLFSGASVGPEGGLGHLSAQLSTWLRGRVAVSEALGRVLVFGGIAATFSAFLGSPLIGTFLVMEMYHYKKYDYDTWILSSLIAGALAFTIYWLLLGEATIKVFDFPEYTEPTIRDALVAMPLGVIGVALATFFGLLNGFVAHLLAPLKKRPLWSAAAGFAAIALAMFAMPIVLFSGHEEIPALLEEGVHASFTMLCALLIGKMLITSVSFATVFKGGPVFPLIFMGAAGGLLVHAIFGIAVPVAVIGIVAGFLTATIHYPLSVILLVLLTSGIAFTPIIVFSAVAGYIALIAAAPLERRAEMLRLIPA